MGDKTWTTVGEIADVYDGPHATPTKTSEGPYFLSISSLENGRLDLAQSAHLSEKDFIKWTKRVQPNADDILFSYETRLGEAALMPRGVKACLGRRMGLLRPDKKKIVPEYLLYSYLSPVFQREIARRTNHGATVNRISLKELPDFPIRVPPIAEQMSVSRILRTLDDKIELNRQTNQTLESLAQALFKSWFVDFDPVIDNALAAGNDIPEPLKARAAARQALGDERKPLPEEIRREFPDAFEFVDEMGWVPCGWTTVKIKHLGRVVTGKTPSKTIDDAYNSTGCLFLTPSDITTEFFINETSRRLTLNAQQFLQKSVIPAGSICTTCIGSQMGKVVLIGEKAVTNQQLNSIDLHDPAHRPLIALNLRSRREELRLLGSSGSTMPIVNKTAFEEILLLMASDALLKAFASIVQPILDDILHMQRMSASTAVCRDTLLPKLLSGELTIPDAEKLAANAL